MNQKLDNLITVLDAGSSKSCVLVAELQDGVVIVMVQIKRPRQFETNALRFRLLVSSRRSVTARLR